MPTDSACRALRAVWCGLLLLAVALPLHGQSVATAAAAGPLSERRVSYVMDVTLDPDTRRLDGKQRITWRNPDRVPVQTLQFHLYLNAFKPGSTFMSESGGRHRGFSAATADPWGGTAITAMTWDDADAPVDLTHAIRFIQTTDANPADETVAEVRLPRAVAPGETIALDVAFAATLPEIVARTGYAVADTGNPFFLVAQWFPKLGAYEIPGQRYVPEDAARGAWSTHQFHAATEFYADFGTYEVTMRVPEAYIVGATGVEVGSETAGGIKSVTYRADDVHDFAWTASPDYLVLTDTWEHVEIKLLLLPYHEAQAERHFEATKIGLAYMDRWVGQYPYPTLTVVDAIGGAGGMEYPTFFTVGTVYRQPAWSRFLEVITIHEFIHQYFQGLIASNEAEEAWLDEGITSYLEMRIMDEAYGPGSMLNIPGLRISDSDYQRLAYTRSFPGRGIIATRAWEHRYASDFPKLAYNKPAVVLKTLEQYLGWDTMEEVLKMYYARWRFRHPTTRDFIAVAEEVAQQDLSWFFDQFLYDDVVVDYRVVSIATRTADAAGVTSTVVLERLGDGVFPQTLRVTYDDGTTEDRAWDGEAEWHRLTFGGRVTEAYLDPDNHVWLDIDRLNNRRTLRPDDTLARKTQLKATAWLQAVFVA
ncbi:MAG: M1 family metallopeptidase, partial [Bacteroidota bacterium]